RLGPPRRPAGPPPTLDGPSGPGRATVVPRLGGAPLVRLDVPPGEDPRLAPRREAHRWVRTRAAGVVQQERRVRHQQPVEASRRTERHLLERDRRPVRALPVNLATSIASIAHGSPSFAGMIRIRFDGRHLVMPSQPGWAPVVCSADANSTGTLPPRARQLWHSLRSCNWLAIGPECGDGDDGDGS